MDTIFVVDVIELYTIIGGLILCGIVFLFMLFYYFYDEHIRYLIHKIKRK